MPIAPDRMQIDGGAVAAPTPTPTPTSAPTLSQLQAASDIATANALQNRGNGPDARYDQRVAAEALAKLNTALSAQATLDAAAKAKADAAAAQAAAEAEAARLAALAANRFSATPNYAPASNNSNSSSSTTTATPIKTATPQFILFNDDEIPVDAIVDLLFENIGGQELLSIVRSDTVNGQKVLYQPIKNLNILKEQYNPYNIIRLQNTSDKFFSNFSIKLSDKIPVVGNGPNGTNIYLDSSGNLVIEFINLSDEEQAEIEITSSGIINEVGI